MTKVALAELLLRRKELGEKVERLRAINTQELFDTRVRRVNVTESTDEIVAEVSTVKFSDVTAAYDYYAAALRRCDASIQRTNWETQVEIDERVLEEYNSQE